MRDGKGFDGYLRRVRAATGAASAATARVCIVAIRTTHLDLLLFAPRWSSPASLLPACCCSWRTRFGVDTLRCPSVMLISCESLLRCRRAEWRVRVRFSGVLLPEINEDLLLLACCALYGVLSAAGFVFSLRDDVLLPDGLPELCFFSVAVFVLVALIVLFLGFSRHWCFGSGDTCCDGAESEDCVEAAVPLKEERKDFRSTRLRPLRSGVCVSRCNTLPC